MDVETVASVLPPDQNLRLVAVATNLCPCCSYCSQPAFWRTQYSQLLRVLWIRRSHWRKPQTLAVRSENSYIDHNLILYNCSFFGGNYAYFGFLSRGRREKPKPYRNNPGKKRIYNSLVKSKGQHKGANVSKRLLMIPTHTLSWKAAIQVPTSNQTLVCSVMLPSQANTGIRMLVYQYPVDKI